MPQAKLTISEVHHRTGIPITTLRFYEKELPNFFTVSKTQGGHRRYTEESVEQFLLIKRMTESDGLRLSQIRDRISAIPTSDDDSTRGQVDLLLSVFEAMTSELEALRSRVGALEREVERLRTGTDAQKTKRGWFR